MALDVDAFMVEFRLRGGGPGMAVAGLLVAA
jgi:hypothetical protein